MSHKRFSFFLLAVLYHNAYCKENNQTEPNQQEGITTLHLEEGNWFIKRQILEKTMDLLEKINTLFTTILESRMSFLTGRDKANREFDLFSSKTGFELADLSQMIASFIEQMQKERTKIGELSLEERFFLESMENKATILNNMHTSLTKISDIDAAIDDVLLQIEQEINKSHEEQTKALRNFRTIKTILNDQKAEELYLSTKNIFENMQEIQKYINGQLKTYFDNNVTQLHAIMQSTTAQLDSFKQEGVDLKKTVEDFINKDTLQAQQLKDKQQEQAALQRPKNMQQPTIFQRISSILLYPFRTLTQWWYKQ